ncbi:MULTISPECIES: DNA-binding transcriptional regulator KdgR [Burkholderia]|jgi:IclR family KDG regulon transcriptional repressor|uniref:Transcriptional regulator kdgR n=2 Tax=Burkholderia gladioli TaxID=28095 RepID=A0A095Y2U1_BURGA|nr:MULTISPECIES: DNA-binding transcriptional regulator KdgR [Burkholderia]AEA61291.1 Transcriptional regulator, IclR family protein [Burkholderia gladioli BSR3]AJW97152.1 transcriptional regulator kdgR [Burkholderia gladioli]ASD80093.1 DNA-binding transcriptional regulator KdgR [Burkholderia gladioli pv. gladioli]ATF83726.1 DNA-binding transcriptional regulator KdgR [Burkholderia gladioli pv. gladioli]AWY54660.1 DNA-binding transcriptional regulator KdgR [Burkholderia gladioli pv. gladioli]
MEAMLRRRKDEAASRARNDEGGEKTESASAAGKVFAVLEALGAHGPIGISELSNRLDMSKTTVHRFLQTLKTLGFVAQEDETERYRLTIRLFELGSQALESVDLVREADVEMRRIGRLTREALHLGAFDEDHIIYIHKIDADYGLRMHSRIGRTNPLYSTAIGKVLLAWMAPEEAREALSRIEFRKSTQKTLASAEAVWSILPHVREQGYGEDNEEQEDGLVCLAVPVFDRFGRVIAGLSISFPTMRCGADTKAHYVALLKQAGQVISSKLGYRGEPL